MTLQCDAHDGGRRRRLTDCLTDCLLLLVLMAARWLACLVGRIHYQPKVVSRELGAGKQVHLNMAGRGVVKKSADVSVADH